ncbi:Gldg family protein [Neiella sp. HB171785]|uniref:Gldg family protein n=1 Tax=Neiella litorisoli TaxID=2771431 RepID=A0A8J6QIV5_9GAMM|nr:Gldg family protein [Neiella litorisoli]MBD1388946.1 Gldg family protein [Neiella litorisoli]
MPQHNVDPANTIKRIAAKEISLFFASPIAYLFLATFAAITLFVFFWGESFFARNIADVRPLFEWMPVLLIFLCATLTMRLWSEERRNGTLEFVLTQSVPLWHFVVGKFLGCLFLLGIALAITVPVPITVAAIADLDWGPVWSGYIATLLLGSAYLSIGLFVSARCDNQIVSLISAAAICGLFYLLGTATITNLFGNQIGEWLRLIGTGSRFESITRGVIDFRDLYYYLSIIAVFLALNTWSLEKLRWIDGEQRKHHSIWSAITALVIVNALVANLWLGQLNSVRIDVTRGNQYSISEATQGYLQQLQEPLLVRGYFSSKTHPLLAPLVPQMRDLIKEYEIAGEGKVRVEFIDPLTNPELEQEANQQFGIQPVPFQIADRYQSSIVSSYFNVLVQYGDEHQVLGFRDLIEIQARSESDIDVQLRNPEHDLTRAIKKVLHSYQASGNLFDTVQHQLTFTAYISADEQLPVSLQEFKSAVQEVTEQIQGQSGNRLTVKFIEPEANGGKVATEIAENYGFKPMAANLFSDQQFFFYLTLSDDKQIVQIPLDDLSQSAFERNLDAGIKRFASGFTKTVALVTPQPDYSNPYGGGATSFNQLEQFLSADLNVIDEDLSDGHISGEADILVLAAPTELDEKSLFAVDQFLMKGGTVIAATSPFAANLSARSLSVTEHQSGLEDWLRHHGLDIAEQMVLDPQNSAFPVPVTRNVGGFSLQEIRLLDYPYFADIREQGLNSDNLISAELPQVTMPWASPIRVDEASNSERMIIPLLQTSSDSWLSDSLDVMPKVTSQGVNAFSPTEERASHLVAVINQGQFDSYFAGKESPLAETDTEQIADNGTDDDSFVMTNVLEQSPQSARIILFSSNDLFADQVIRMLGSAQQTDYLHSIQMMANAIDWSLEDEALLSIRSRGHFNRTLPPMEQSSQMFWEYLNYAFAAIAIVLVALWERRKKAIKHKKYLELLAV